MSDLLRTRIIPSLPGDRAAAGLALASLAALLGHWAAVLWFVVPRLGQLEFLRLHYTAGLGVDRVGSWWLIFATPAVGLAVLIVNGFIAAALVRRGGGDGRRISALALLVLAATLAQQCILLVGGIIAVSLNR